MSPMPGCVSEPLGCGLIDTPGKRESPGIAELAFDRLRVVAAARRLEEAAAGFEHDRRRGPAERGEIGRDDARFGGAPGMERLGHRPEVLAQSRRLARRDAERAARLLDVESHQAGGAAAAAIVPIVAVEWKPRQRSVARCRHRHLRQERAGRAGGRRPAEPAHGSDHGRRDGVAIHSTVIARAGGRSSLREDASP